MNAFGYDTLLFESEKLYLMSKVSYHKLRKQEAIMELSKVRNIIFEVTNGCNFRCRYCFESQNQTIKSHNMVLSFDTINQVLSQIMIQGKTVYHITLFGGEPLLAKSVIIDTIRIAKQRARSIESYVSFNVISNCSMLDETYMKLFCKEDVFLFASFDGSRSTQNKYRLNATGEETFDLVHTNLLSFLTRRLSTKNPDYLVIRMTVTRDAILSLPSTYRRLVDEGFPKVTFALVSSKEKDVYSISENDLPDLRSAYRELGDIYIQEIKDGCSHNRFFESLVRRICEGTTRSFFCNCGKKYLAVGADGKYYPCEGFLGIPEFCIGSCNNESLVCTDITLESVLQNSQCVTCWAKYICGGGCYHENWMNTGCVNAKDSLMCETYRIAAEEAIRIYNRLQSEGLIDTFLDITRESLPIHAIPAFNSHFAHIIDHSLYYCSDSHQIIYDLDEMSYDILNMCKANYTIDSILKELLEVYDVEEDVLFNDVSLLLQNWIDDDILFLRCQ